MSIQEGLEIFEAGKIWSKILGFKVGDSVECHSPTFVPHRGYIVLQSKRDLTRFLIQTTQVYLKDKSPNKRWCCSKSGLLPFRFEEMEYWNTREKVPRKVKRLLLYYRKYPTSW